MNDFHAIYYHLKLYENAEKWRRKLYGQPNTLVHWLAGNKINGRWRRKPGNSHQNSRSLYARWLLSNSGCMPRYAIQHNKQQAHDTKSVEFLVELTFFRFTDFKQPLHASLLASEFLKTFF